MWGKDRLGKVGHEGAEGHLATGSQGSLGSSESFHKGVNHSLEEPLSVEQPGQAVNEKSKLYIMYKTWKIT